MAHFEIKDLTFAYAAAEDRIVLDNINLDIEQGQYVTICGKSGSGKTTLLKHLKSVLMPHGKRSGQIIFEGQDLEQVDLRSQASKIGYVMQNPDNQIVTDKVWHELAFGLESLGEDQNTIRLRVAEMASFFGIQSWFHKDVAELSGGQKQLLNLASIMAMQPTVLILDEPTSQLDPIAASDFLNTVRKINLELGTTIIITEHRLEDIFHASDRVVVMDKGRIIADDEPKKVGEFLKGENREMFAAMPSPVQIFYGVRDDLKSKGFKEDDEVFECPLTVREGRNWLSAVFPEAGAKPLQETSVEEKEWEEIDDPIVTAKEVWFRYEKNAPDVLKGASFKVGRGSIFSIVGGNGTGKSTMLKAICNICKPYRGKILTDGNVKLAMLPQDPQSLFVKKTVREELEEMLDDKNDAALIDEVAEICDISHLFENHPYDLSGGEQQRTALAKVLLTQPDVLLLDEPTKGMDNFFKLQFAKILSDLKAKGVTIIMVSHDIEFCARYADSVSMFFDGGIITSNTPHRFFTKNSFYTTAANRMSRHLFVNAITNEDVIELCKKNL